MRLTEISITIVLVLSLVSCGRYQFFVNEQLVYSPPPLFSAFSAENEHLHNCLVQTIQDQRITSPEQLRQLNCSNAGITSILGLEQFNKLEKINFDDNLIENLSPLSKITTAQSLQLANNRIRDASPLAELKQLKTIKLAGNDRIRCETLSGLRSRSEVVLDAPKHCIAGTTTID